MAIEIRDLPRDEVELGVQEMRGIQGGTIGFSMVKPVYEWIEAS